MQQINFKIIVIAVTLPVYGFNSKYFSLKPSEADVLIILAISVCEFI